MPQPWRSLDKLAVKAMAGGMMEGLGIAELLNSPEYLANLSIDELEDHLRVSRLIMSVSLVSVNPS